MEWLRASYLEYGERTWLQQRARLRRPQR
jgi:hypothetical protein